MILTPKEKAEELVRKYYTFGLNNTAQSFSWYECKQCALIAVNNTIDAFGICDCTFVEQELEYWQAVKQELEKL